MSRATVDLQGVRFFLGYGLIFFFQNVLTVVSVTRRPLLRRVEARADRARDHAAARRARVPLQPRRRTRRCATCSRSSPTSRPSPRRTSSASTSSRRSRRSRPRRRSSGAAPRRVFGRRCARTASARLYVPLISFLPLLAQAAVLLVGGRMVVARLALGRRRSSLQPLPRDARRCRSARSGCGSARRSARPPRASASSR